MLFNPFNGRASFLKIDILSSIPDGCVNGANAAPTKRPFQTDYIHFKAVLGEREDFVETTASRLQSLEILETDTCL